MADRRNVFGVVFLQLLILFVLAVPQNLEAQETSERPNVVLMFPDNLGWGEVGAYGSVRGVPTPRIDQIANEGIRISVILRHLSMAFPGSPFVSGLS